MVIINFTSFLEFFFFFFFFTTNSHGNLMVKEKFELYCKGQLVCEPMDLIIKIFKNAHTQYLLMLKDLGIDYQVISTIKAE